MSFLQAWAKLPIHRKSSIRASKVRKLLKRAFDDFVMKSPFDLGYEIKGLVVAKSYYLLDAFQWEDTLQNAMFWKILIK